MILTPAGTGSTFPAGTSPVTVTVPSPLSARLTPGRAAASTAGTVPLVPSQRHRASFDMRYIRRAPSGAFSERSAL